MGLKFFNAEIDSYKRANGSTDFDVHVTATGVSVVFECSDREHAERLKKAIEECGAIHG